MFENLGQLKNLEKKYYYTIDQSEISSNINLFDNFIIYKDQKKLKVYDRRCDHAGGKIISINNEIICPVHNWKFDPKLGQYKNGVKKKETNYSIIGNKIKIETTNYQPVINKFVKKDYLTKIRFFNHAFLKVYSENFSFAIDPWAIGPAFNTGWWLKNPTKDDWSQDLNDSSFIFISHNHPDHLHPLTLSKVNKKMPIVVPKFASDSAGKYIEDLGFTNIIRLDFNIQYNLIGTNLVLCVLKSGDFSEDSGIYFSNGNFTGLLSVDTNSINFGRFPKTNFYACSFAGGASGYPLMFENYKESERIKIAKKNKKFVKTRNCINLKKVNPNYFMPYAGFFDEKLQRDSNIKKNNQKNTINDYKDFCHKNNIKLLNIFQYDLYNFNGCKLTKSSSIKKKKTKDLKQSIYLDYFKQEYQKIDEKYLKDYFVNSKFTDKLNLYILLTNDNFDLIGKNYFIDFTKLKTSFKKIDKFQTKDIFRKSSVRKLVLKTRKESFLNTIYNKLPWEDLLIGFQCKVLRNPNIHNLSFWHYFSNVYTSSKNVRSLTNCGACTKLSHFFDNKIYSKIQNIR